MMCRPNFPFIRFVTISALILLSFTLRAAAAHEKVIHTFEGMPGENPMSKLIFDSAGNLYGAATYGGKGKLCGNGRGGCGAVFKLSLESNGWTYKVLYEFKGGQDGANPNGTLTFDTAGNLYGTTLWGGGSTLCTGGCGTIFELSPNSSGGWTENILYRFAGGNDGVFPAGPVVLDAAGNIYGATVNGGSARTCGTVFELSPGFGGQWTEKILYVFQGGIHGPDGSNPSGGLAIDTSGNLFGTTVGGGTGDNGIVFQLTQIGGVWNESILYSFQGGYKDGWGANSGVTLDSSDNLYGTTYAGGSKYNCGTVFELRPGSAGQWTESILHRFRDINKDGCHPEDVPTLDATGSLYGTTAGGGYQECGTVFKLVPGTGGKWTHRNLHVFSCRAEGNQPWGSVTLDSAGNVFGTTAFGGSYKDLGVAFEIKP